MKVVDCDTHFWQPLPLWESYIDPAYRDKIREAMGKVKLTHEAVKDKDKKLGAVYERPMDTKIASQDTWVGFKDRLARAQEIRGGDHADARIEWMDREGIDACIIYPTLAGTLAFNDDSKMSAAACRALNRWAADFMSAAPDRLKPCMLLPWYDPKLALEELDFALKLGLKQAFATPSSSNAHRWSDPIYDPIWKALQDNNVVMTYHEFTRVPAATADKVARPTFLDNYAMMYMCGHTVEIQLTLMDLLFGGVFNRFPKLPFLFVEAHIAWLPGWLASLDQQWNRAKSTQDLTGWKDTELKPSELFRRQGGIVAFPDDNWIPETFKYVGENNLMICSDYPHPQARFEMVKKFDELHPNMDPTLRSKILGDNAAKMFGLE